MKIRILLATALLLSVSAGAFALSPEYNEFGQGPAQFFMTKEEAAQWKAIKSDDEAKAFVALFWARRDPTPGTPANEFRMQFDAAVVYADKNLGNGKRNRGAMTDRGRTLILYGQPKKVERSAPRQATSGPMNDTITEDNDQWIQWIYEGTVAREMFNMQNVTIRFIDRAGTNDYKFDRGGADLTGAQQRAVTKSITQPNLTSAPTAAPAAAAMTPAIAAPAAATPAPVAAPAAALTELPTEALAKAVEELKAAKSNPYPKPVYATWGEFVTPKGEDFVPVTLYVPKSAGISATSAMTFFGVVQDESGKNIAAFEEPAKVLSASKEDFYVDKTLTLPGGKNRGYFGLAENGKAVAMVATDMNTAGSLDKDAPAVSPLILSNNIFPLTEAQNATDPFAFGGVKVVPKADKLFHKSDELWYFFELRNPGVAEAAPAADASTVPVTGTPAPAAAMPKIQVSLDVQGVDATGKKHKMAAPPREVDAIEMKGVPGHYGVGSAIPLASFVSGDYTFTVKVIDTVKKASYTISDKFKIVD